MTKILLKFEVGFEKIQLNPVSGKNEIIFKLHQLVFLNVFTSEPKFLKKNIS